MAPYMFSPLPVTGPRSCENGFPIVNYGNIQHGACFQSFTLFSANIHILKTFTRCFTRKTSPKEKSKGGEKQRIKKVLIRAKAELLAQVNACAFLFAATVIATSGSVEKGNLHMRIDGSKCTSGCWVFIPFL